jgi:hypothetical protein
MRRERRWAIEQHQLNGYGLDEKSDVSMAAQPSQSFHYSVIS